MTDFRGANMIEAELRDRLSAKNDEIAALRAERDAAREALAALVSLKDYAANVGKDAAYKRGRDAAWVAARAALASAAPGETK